MQDYLEILIGEELQRESHSLAQSFYCDKAVFGADWSSVFERHWM